MNKPYVKHKCLHPYKKTKQTLKSFITNIRYPYTITKVAEVYIKKPSPSTTT